MINWMKKWWRYITHPNPCCFDDDRITLVSGRYAFVKCRNCGCESIPWRISEEKADQWRERHKKEREEFGV